MGKYVNQNPKQLVIMHEDKGKPFLGTRQVEFNMSHAVDQAIFAFSLDGDLGVDIEGRREIPEAGAIVKRLFSSREKWIFNMATANNKPDVFLKCWTRGEAVVKAVGYGFGERVGTISRRKVMNAGKTWRIESFIPAPGYIGAIAALNALRNIRCWELIDGLFLPAIIQ
jgi:hypothetical protein